MIDDDVASRLTLQTLLRAGGYSVDVASSAAEAIEKLDSGEYVLVLSDLGMKSPEEGLEVLAYARRKEYRPATASWNSRKRASTSPRDWEAIYGIEPMEPSEANRRTLRDGTARSR